MAKAKRSKTAESAVAPMPAATPEDPRCVTLIGPLEIQQVEGARGLLLAALEHGSGASVDVTGITSIDTAGVQLLWALRIEAPRWGGDLEFRGASAPLDGALKALGLPPLNAGAAQHGV